MISPESITTEFGNEINWGFGDCAMFAVGMRTIFPETKMMLTGNQLHVFVEFPNGAQMDYDSYPYVSSSYYRLTQSKFHQAPGITDWEWNKWYSLIDRLEILAGKRPKISIAYPYLSIVKKILRLSN